MMSLDRVTLIFGLLCILSTAATPETRNFSREWIIDDTNEALESLTIGRNNVFIYHECKDIENNIEAKNKNCTLHYEFFNKNGNVYHYKCYFQLRARNESQQGIPGIEVRSFYGKKVLIAYMDYLSYPVHLRRFPSGYVIHRMIDMSTCKYKDYDFYIKYEYFFDDLYQEYEKNVGFTNTLEVPAVVQYKDGSFELFVANRTVCNAARCRITVRADGTRAREIVPYLPPNEDLTYKNVIMHPSGNPDEYFAVVTEHRVDFIPDKNRSFSLLYVYPYGTFKELLHFKKDKRRLDFDATDGHMTVCWTSVADDNVDIIHCVQYNSKRVLIMNISFHLPYSTHFVKIKNFRDGGFILLTQECVYGPDEDEECIEGSTYYLRNVLPGKDLGPMLEMEGFRLQQKFRNDIRRIELNLSYPDGENICVSLIVNRYGGHGFQYKKQFFRRCIPSDYLMGLETDIHF